MKTFNDFDLTNYNSYKLKAKCKRAYFPENNEDIRQLFKVGAPKRLLLGGGYNVILSKEFYDEDFVIFSDTFAEINLINESSISCQAGVDLKVLSEFALQNGLSGLEIYYDIPSSMGGAVVMNAGAGGEDIHGILEKVKYYDPESDQFKEISQVDIGFEYRNSFFQKNTNLIICKAYLKLKKGDKQSIKQKMEVCKEKRWAKQPRSFPNAGSVFKRPPGRYVGPMLDELGLKNFKMGDAMISDKHSGFIINLGNATGNDIIKLIEYVQNKVKLNYGINLEVEQRII